MMCKRRRTTIIEDFVFKQLEIGCWDHAREQIARRWSTVGSEERPKKGDGGGAVVVILEELSKWALVGSC
jgi:hypothetical protein